MSATRHRAESVAPKERRCQHPPAIALIYRVYRIYCARRPTVRATRSAPHFLFPYPTNKNPAPWRGPYAVRREREVAYPASQSPAGCNSPQISG